MKRSAPPLGAPLDDRATNVVVSLLERFWLGRVTAADYADERAVRGADAPLTLLVTGRTVVAQDNDVVALTFAAPDGATLPAWQPGSHLDLHLPSGRRRQYSLCGDPQDRSRYRIAVRRIPDGGGGSLEMHALSVGDTVTVRSPRNGFPFIPYERALYIAGGIGITPVLPMVLAAQRLGTDWHFVYCGRSAATIPFLDEIASWDPSRVTIRFDDEHGLPTVDDLLGHAPAGGAVYVCGPPPMIETVRQNFDRSGAAALHFERFSAPPVRDGTAFEIELARSGEVLPVAADETVLDALVRHRPDTAYSCRQGFCGTCRVGVLAGTAEHRENRLTAEERETSMLPCVSRSLTSRLTLDI
ncbi:PDR/VanB family oxidoreductase [Mycolicibacterium frederiksbergense]|uniref:Oxidoreductase n=1 Tax=Mycolicibacterium frederiksbergense TaxID=117567 RepID=A0A6H0S353_9MYCO|nr:PDR/VanB family oxidoreductase [Mycolicibacterium frederiksbergense]QIV81798.1 oxidoreductase [Mycolicibacterium frederiksbergense]